jgi:hypothetical protein
MIKKQPLCSQRVRRISASFAFIEHRFLQDGFWQTLDHHERLRYLFLVIVADRDGLSYYSYDKFWTLMRILVDAYIVARNSLIAFDGHMFQVRSLAQNSLIPPCNLLRTQQDVGKHDPGCVGQLIAQRLSCKNGKAL